MPKTSPPCLRYASRRFREISKEKIGSVKGGVSARFVQINDEWGLKVYRNKRIAIICYAAQREAHKLGLAPEVGAFGKTQFGWGFVTEFAPSRGDDLGLPYSDCEEVWEEEDALYAEPEYHELRAALGDAGFNDSDLHIFNVGVDTSGKMVSIDFDREAVCWSEFRYDKKSGVVWKGTSSVWFE